MNVRTISILSIAAAAASWLGCATPRSNPTGGAAPSATPSAAVSTEGAKIAAAVQAEVDAKRHKLGDYKRADGSAVSILSVASLRVDISASCLQKDGKLACAAFEALKAISGKRVVPGPGNPASYYCEPVGATNTTLTSAAGQAGYCSFTDGSLVSDWTLVYTPALVLTPKGR